jgi:hypothetical protein
MLARVPDLAHLMVAGCDPCTVALRDGSAVAVLATSDRLLAGLEERRFRTGAGADVARRVTTPRERRNVRDRRRARA